MNKKNLSERDICTKFITPNLVAAGWDVDSQVREEVGCDTLSVRRNPFPSPNKKGSRRSPV